MGACAERSPSLEPDTWCHCCFVQSPGQQKATACVGNSRGSCSLNQQGSPFGIRTIGGTQAGREYPGQPALMRLAAGATGRLRKEGSGYHTNAGPASGKWSRYESHFGSNAAILALSPVGGAEDWRWSTFGRRNGTATASTS